MSTLINNRLKEIKEKGFNMTLDDTRDPYSDVYVPTDFSKIKVGIKTLDDAVLNLGTLKRIDPRLSNKEVVLKAIATNDLETMRDISNFFYRTSGIYNRLCRYLAYMYRYDWMVTPYINLEKESVVSDWRMCFEKHIDQRRDGNFYIAMLGICKRRKAYLPYLEEMRDYQHDSQRKRLISAIISGGVKMSLYYMYYKFKYTSISHQFERVRRYIKRHL